MGTGITALAVGRPGAVAWVTVGVSAAIALAATLPSLPADWPVVAQLQPALSGLHGIEVDTDPENMLSASEPVRVFHNRMVTPHPSATDSTGSGGSSPSLR
jgi:hypothetical protein